MTKIPDNDIISEMMRTPRWQILQALKEPSTSKTVADLTGHTYNNAIHHLKALERIGVVESYPSTTNARQFIYQRRSVFAEVLVDYKEGSELVTALDLVVTKKGGVKA